MAQASSIDKLAAAVSDNPTNAELLFLLAAEMAQQKDYVGAIAQYEAALEISPDLHTARLQLGLLCLTMADLPRFMEVLAPLDDLDPANPFKSFKVGLQALAEDKFDLCVQALTEGIALNNQNPTLNVDMQLIIDRVSETLDVDKSRRTADGETSPSANIKDEKSADLSLYKSIDE